MKRQESVYKKLVELSSFSDGCTTSELAEELNISRANISNELNKLYELKRVLKSNGRPVRYYPVSLKEGEEALVDKVVKSVDMSNNNVNENDLYNCLDVFLKENLSLKTQVNQARAAVLYPPNGMNMLILGDTGVGKSMFAELTYKYAVEVKKFKKNAPFIVFNCADYVNNPQLLLSQLFGAKKGAYTGADIDREGLIEKADKGVLFLDEIHRLPSEGQEMLFVFLDKGKYRRLGETESERKANVLIICATTEEPSSALLNTFIRRIPMIIKIPNLKERYSTERLNLINCFLKNESNILGKEIKLSRNALKAFLQYPCENNIGQLKADIQQVCAKAYAEYLTNRRGSIKINTTDLPEYIRDYLYIDLENEKLLTDLGIKDRYVTISKDNSMIESCEKSIDNNIYEFIEDRVENLKSESFMDKGIDEILYKELYSYFNKYIHGINEYHKNTLNSLLDENITNLLGDIDDIILKKLNKRLSKNMSIGLLLYLNTAIYKVKNNKRKINDKLLYTRKKYRMEFEAALEIIKIIEEKLDLTLSIDEAGYITLFLVKEENREVQFSSQVGIIVMCHGDSTATSMAKVANDLLEENYAIGINLPLGKSRIEIMDILRATIKNKKTSNQYIFLVDMGSLLSINEILSEELDIQIKQINNVSTIHVIEATRKALLGEKLEEIYVSLSNENEVNVVEEISDKKKYSIVVACSTGEGSAVIISNYLQKHLRYNKNIFDVIPLSINNKENFYIDIREIQKEKEIICIVSTLKIQMDVPQYTLEEVLSLKVIDRIQEIVDIKHTYEELSKTLKEHIKNVDGEILYEDIVQVLFNFQSRTKIVLTSELFIPIAMHIACMVDRLLSKITVVEYKGSDEYKDTNSDMYKLVKEILKPLSHKYNVEITNDEYWFITEFLSEI